MPIELKRVDGERRSISTGVGIKYTVMEQWEAAGDLLIAER